MNKAKHFDQGKVGLQYILAMPIVDEMARIGEWATRTKYKDYWNFRKGMPWMKLLGSCARHLTYFIRGENNDKESGYSHLAHLAYDAAMLYDLLRLHPNLNDRPRGC